MSDRLAEANAKVNRLVHELESNRGVKIWPVVVICDGCRVSQPFDPEPEEPVLAAALIALGWSFEHGHRCRRCARGR